MPPGSASLTTDMTGEAMAASGASASCGWHFIVLMSRQGKIRLSEFFSSFSESEKRRILRDIAGDVLPRAAKMCNIIEKGSYKFVYRRYASLYFVIGVPQGMNELIVLEQIHLFVEALDGYFNSGTYRQDSSRSTVFHGAYPSAIALS
jgi:AP-1 complex subunit sigma 1/2